MTAPFIVVIPARYGATRLPGKPLRTIGDKPLIQHVYEPASASAATRVYIATDHPDIEKAARSFGGETIMTSGKHASGTDRIAEVVDRLGEPDDTVIVNVQGDEFGLAPGLVDQVAAALHAHPDRVMATLGVRLESREEWLDPHAVKVLVSAAGDAIYFSRAPIPWQDSDQGIPPGVLRHMGIYAYRAGFLRTFSGLTPCPLESSERLEQLRALHNGYHIRVEEARGRAGIGVDTEDDLERARRRYVQAE